jgi:hypothetical protein
MNIDEIKNYCNDWNKKNLKQISGMNFLPIASIFTSSDPIEYSLNIFSALSFYCVLYCGIICSFNQKNNTSSLFPILIASVILGFASASNSGYFQVSGK